MVATNKSVNEHRPVIEAWASHESVVAYINVDGCRQTREENIECVRLVVAAEITFGSEPSVKVARNGGFPAVRTLARAEAVRVNVEVGVASEDFYTRCFLSDGEGRFFTSGPLENIRCSARFG